MATDPFDENPNHPQATAGPAPEKQSKGLVFWLASCLGGVVIVGLICCGGGYFLAQKGAQMVGTEYQQLIQNDPVIVEKIGEVESFGMSLKDAVAYAEELKPGELPFRIVGSKGDGVVFIEGEPPEIRSARLLTSDGEKFPLELNSKPPVDLDFDLDSVDMGESIEP